MHAEAQRTGMIAHRLTAAQSVGGPNFVGPALASSTLMVEAELRILWGALDAAQSRLLEALQMMASEGIRGKHGESAEGLDMLGLVASLSLVDNAGGEAGGAVLLPSPKPVGTPTTAATRADAPAMGMATPAARGAPRRVTGGGAASTAALASGDCAARTIPTRSSTKSSGMDATTRQGGRYR